MDGIAKGREVVGIGRAVAEVADLKLMEVAVRPAHDGLDVAMDPGQSDAAGHLDATPDRGSTPNKLMVSSWPVDRGDMWASSAPEHGHGNTAGAFVDVRVCVGEP